MKGEVVKGWLERLKEYRMALLVLAVGMFLLMLPTSGADRRETESIGEGKTAEFSLEEFQAQLERILSSVEGAGDVRVALTVKSGERRVLAQDIRREEDGYTATTVLVGKLSSQQESVVVQTTAPVFQGALVVCPGGGEARVRLVLMEAVCALTGLGSDRVFICEGNR